MAAGPLQPSGRVIAGGRLLLACLFLLAVWVDASQPARAHAETYTLLAAYVAWSLAVTLIVWNDWWQDARLAAPAHVVDVAVFMLMLYATAGYTSPYFTFFIFILLAAAIRWGWKETSVTAAAIIAIYVAVGLFLGPDPQVELDRFIVRTGHLLIISAILIWFGANQWVAWRRLGQLEGPAGIFQGDAFIAALQAGMSAVGARRGTLLWQEPGDEEVIVARVSDDGASRAASRADIPKLAAGLLFDLARDRVLMRAEAGRWRFLRASEALAPAFRDAVAAGEGLAMPIATGTAEGLVVFQDVRALSTDHLDVAPRIGHELAVRIQEAALFAAVEERSMAKARVAVARDLHDSVVQFLAGLGFRLEALKRSPAAAGELADGLADLKETVMTEQRQLKAFIRGLGTGTPSPFNEVSRDCASLCELLARQWAIECSFAGEAGSGSIAVRTQLDVQQLIREAVANAVRHGGAGRVAVSLAGERTSLLLTVADDGRGFPPRATADEPVPPPASLSGRVREARGKLEVASEPGATSIFIRLPMEPPA